MQTPSRRNSSCRSDLRFSSQKASLACLDRTTGSRRTPPPSRKVPRFPPKKSSVSFYFFRVPQACRRTHFARTKHKARPITITTITIIADDDIAHLASVRLRLPQLTLALTPWWNGLSHKVPNLEFRVRSPVESRLFLVSVASIPRRDTFCLSPSSSPSPSHCNCLAASLWGQPKPSTSAFFVRHSKGKSQVGKWES